MAARTLRAQKRPVIKKVDHMRAEMRSVTALRIGKTVLILAGCDRIGDRALPDLWVLDPISVVSELRSLNTGRTDTDLRGMLNLTRIGVIGQSFGGVASTRFCNLAPVCLASINMDGTDRAAFGERLERPHRPYFSDGGGLIADIIRDGGASDDTTRALIRQIVPDQEIHEIHPLISARQQDPFVLTLKDITQQGFVLGWLGTHDFRPGKKRRYAALAQASIAFLDSYFKPRETRTANPRLCRALKTTANMRADHAQSCD